jgi:hypothetical protein
MKISTPVKLSLCYYCDELNSSTEQKCNCCSTILIKDLKK